MLNVEMKKNKNTKAYKKYLIFGIAFFILYALTWTLVFRNERNDNEASKKALESMPFVAKSKLEGKTSVDSKQIVQKLDLQRKIIRPSSPQRVAEINRIIQQQGGEIIKSDANIIVAHLPKDKEEQINQELESTNSTSTIEVDYPTFLTADNPDWGVKRIKAPDVWDTTTASGIKVAVIDTGIDYNHSDLQGRYAGGYDTANDDNDPYDDHGHGTHVSGTIATALNGSGLAGVAPGVQILAVKALHGDGTGYISDVVEAVDYAMRNGTQVMNFSIGTSYNSSALEEKLNEAAARGIILVAAAGNTSGGSLLYPAAYGSVISVAATDSGDNFASFSSVGAEIAAPGVGITSTVPGGGYASWSGTSMASPHVAATVALMLANNQTNIRQSLQNTAIDLGPSGKDGYYGYGLVHSKPATLGEDVLAPIVTFLTPDNDSTVYGEVEINLDVQDEYKLTSIKLYANNEQIQEWTESVSSHTWDTTGKEGSYELRVVAIDENENEGSAKITVTVSKDPISPTPTVTPKPSLHQMKQQGQSGNVRHDINQEQAQQNRQDYQNVPNNPQEAQGKSESNNQPAQAAPDVSNINERNQKPHAASENSGGRDVKGASTISFWQILQAKILSLFNK
jgi:hypothetical protein